MSTAPCLGSEPSPTAAEVEDSSPARGAPRPEPGTLRCVCQSGLGGVTGHSASISRFWIFRGFFFFFFSSPPCKVGHLLLFQLPLSFFGTRQILSFDAEGIRLSGPEYCRGRAGVPSQPEEDTGQLEAWVR